MRFIADGPDIPDDLLVARDEGRVIVFCGSGVSIAKAKLPGFLGLAENVMHELRALPDSAPRQLTQIAETLQVNKIAGVGSIVAADRIFGLLEREFAPADIDRAVGAVLKRGTDSSAHQILLDLGRTANGGVRLVTTNFDLLFEKAAPKLRTWTPDDLPDLQRGTFNGIVHLHGMLDPDYQKSVGGNLILSSAEFGRAYLSEGWATRFIRDATEKYSVLFVGYTADDPPVQYLLEALNRDRGHKRLPMYAFQPGLRSDAAALWTHKGVTAIPYDDQYNHAFLWQTLAAWAERARNPEAWRKRVLQRARKGPQASTPHERGQVMHLARTRDGVKAIVTAKPPLKAEWLLVFDPTERYETPGRRTFSADAAPLDNFRHYSLDSDPLPKADDGGSFFREREVPKEALNALVGNEFDAPSREKATIYGDNAVSLISLSPRLQALVGWIAKVADQPLAVWWALNKTLLHPTLLQSVELRFRHTHNPMQSKARAVWRYIIDSRRPRFRSTFHNVYDLKDGIAKDGWTPTNRRYLMNILRPRLEVTRPMATGPVKDIERARLFKILNVSLKYPQGEPLPEVPDSELAIITPQVRRLLEEVSAHEEELGGFTLNHIPPINPDPNLDGVGYERDHGFGRLVFWYVRLFQRLAAHNAIRGRHEFDAWLWHDNTLFYRLRVWACGLRDFLPSDIATQALATLNDSAFWTERGQRDVLLSLKARWNDFDAAARSSVEARLLKGPPRFKFASPAQNREWRAHMILERVLWLIREGCAFERPVTRTLAKARAAAPHWKDEFASHAADSHEGRGASVKTNSEFDQIKDAPLRELLSLCITASGRDRSFSIDRDPLGGLAEKRPIRVLRALLLNALPDDQARLWAWSKFLHSSARRDDKPLRTCLIASRLVEIPDALFKLIVQPVSYWLEGHAQSLYHARASLVGDLVDRILAALEAEGVPADGKGKRSSDWLTSAMSSPAGHVAQVLLHDPTLAARKVGEGVPDDWKRRVERSIALPDDQGLFAFHQISHSLAWLFGRDPVWTESVFLSALDVEGERQEALLAAFLHDRRFGERAFYERLKGPIFKLISGELALPRADPHALTILILSGWLATDADGRWLSDTEMRSALVRGQQELRTTMLWQIEQREYEEKSYFLKEVWPLHLAARNPTITDRLCHIVFHDAEHFAELAQIVMPFLTPIRRGALMFTAGVPNTNALLGAHPQIALELYWRILPEDSEEWPYGAHEGLEYLHKNVKSVRSDPRMIELMRRRRKGYF